MQRYASLKHLTAEKFHEMRKLNFIAIIIALALTSCKKDDTICYGNTTMGNISGANIISDQGNIFNIVNGNIDLSKFEYGRVMLMCDVLKQTGENQYDINLIGISSVLTKETVKASGIQDEESEYNVDNAINIRELWCSGGYINMLLELLVKNGSDTKHLINLIYDDTAEDGKYSLTLRHNAFGEVPTDDDMDYTPSWGYASFPIADIISGDSAEISFRWKSHKYENGQFSMTESTDIEKTFNWNKEGFLHENLIPTTPSPTLYMNFLAR